MLGREASPPMQLANFRPALGRASLGIRKISSTLIFGVSKGRRMAKLPQSSRAPALASAAPSYLSHARLRQCHSRPHLSVRPSDEYLRPERSTKNQARPEISRDASSRHT